MAVGRSSKCGNIVWKPAPMLEERDVRVSGTELMASVQCVTPVPSQRWPESLNRNRNTNTNMKKIKIQEKHVNPRIFFWKVLKEPKVKDRPEYLMFLQTLTRTVHLKAKYNWICKRNCKRERAKKINQGKNLLEKPGCRWETSGRSWVSWNTNSPP